MKFQINKASYVVLGLTIIVVISTLFSPAQSASSNPCSSCHSSSYNQVLDILEGDNANQLPTAINVGQTKTVIVAIKNDANTDRYSILSSVSVTLRSKNGHFAVKKTTFDFGSFSAGTQNAIWEITGTSNGQDFLLISASGRNSHENLIFSDSYLPLPTIAVGNANPSAPSIQLNSPAEDENWVVNSTHNISWSSTGGVGQVKVTLEYSSTGNDLWLNIASDLSSSGSYTWKMPDSIVSNIYVRVTVVDSASPPNTASTISQIQVVQPSAISSSSSSPSSSSSIPEFPAMPILFVFMLVLVFFSVLLRKFLE